MQQRTILLQSPHWPCNKFLYKNHHQLLITVDYKIRLILKLGYKFSQRKSTQTRNLDGISMNIYEKNSALNFCVQNEREWTLETFAHALTILDPLSYHWEKKQSVVN